MRLRLILLILVAGGASFGAVTLARGWLDDRRAEFAALQASEPVQVETIDTVEVLVASEDLPSGTFLALEQFSWVPFPVDILPASYITKASLYNEDGTADAQSTDAEDPLTGAVVRGFLAAGDPLTAGRVIRPGDRGFLAAVLKPGLRAVSVPIDATSGIAGFVFPGDRVDLLLTHKVKLGGSQERLATETLQQDIRVLAVDQRTDDTEGKPALAKTATLEVDSKQAEVIAVALRMGRLSLALRSLAQQPDALATATPSDEPEHTYTWDSQASRLLPPVQRAATPVTNSDTPPPPPPPKVKVTVFRSGEAQTVEFKGRVQ